MKRKGGRATTRLFVAAALLLLLLPILPGAPAQSSADPWWGVSDRTRPTEGFAIRVPVSVENKLDYVVTDVFVAAEIDFGKLLVAAGWPNQTIGAETRVRGFTLDVDSIRVVPYSRGFVTGPLEGPTQQPIPHTFYPALLESAKFREFDAARNPAGTVLFQLDGELRPQEKRDFYIYANPLEYGKAPPATVDLLARGPLDAYLWGTSGTVAYGYEPHQAGQKHLVHVRSLATGLNRVTVSTFELGRYVPLVSTQTYPNPATLQVVGDTATFYVPPGKAYKVESQRPVQVYAVGQDGTATSGSEATGYLPGRSGSFADNAFSIYVPPNAPPLTLVKASAGTFTVTATQGFAGVGTRTLSNARPTEQFLSLPTGWVQLGSEHGKFLAFFEQQQAGTRTPYSPRQVPAITGGPSGTSFYTYVMNDAGYVRLCPDANVSLRFVELPAGTVQLFPEGIVPTVPPAVLEPKPMCEEVAIPRGASNAQLHEAYSVVPDNAPAGTKPAPFRVFAGAGARNPTPSENYTRSFRGAYGGLGGVDYDLFDQVGLFGHYNDTRITIFEEKVRADGSTFIVNRTRGLQRDEFAALLPGADSTGRWHVVSTKPIGAVSLASAAYKVRVGADDRELTVPYLVHVPGRPLPPSISIGKAEFRGPVVDLRSPARPGDQFDFLTTGPGSPVTYRLDVWNLGRWVGGEDLPDTITISCSAPAGWRVDGCAKEVSLGSGSAERLSVVVTPSTDDVNVTRSILVEARSRAGGAIATFKLSVHVEVRYGVGMWFDVEGGRKTVDPPVGVDPAGTYSYAIVVKNTGSTQDSFTLAVDDPRPGWTQELRLAGQPVTSVLLDGGESATLEFRVRAPNAETAPQNIVSILAQSRSSALAADVVNTATRIRPKVDLELTLEPQTRLAAPNETVVFNITTRNKGNDVFTVLFEQDSILPKGWESRLSVPEITLNPNPSNDPTLNYVLQLSVRPPEGARAGDLASVKLTAEIDTGGAGGRVAGDEISAVVVVRRVYELVIPPVPDADALPGETLRFSLPITNRGNGQVSLELLAGAVEATLLSENGDARVVPDWRVTLEEEALTLDLNESADLPLRVEVPAGAPPGLYNLTFTTRLSREALQNLTAPVAVRAVSRVVFDGAADLPLVPGRPVALSYVARNTGNVEGAFDLRAAAPSGWQATLSPARAELAPGDAVPVTLTLNATREAPDGAAVVTLQSQAANAAPTPTPLRVQVARPQLSLGDVSATGALRAGELVLVSANIVNGGGIDATNVSIALVVDDRVVDRVTLSRIPVGSTSLATLSWVATQRGGDVRVVIDPEEEIALPSREDTEAEVQFASRIPGPGLLALVAILGVLARLRRGAEAPKDGSAEGERTSELRLFGTPDPSRSAQEREDK